MSGPAVQLASTPPDRDIARALEASIRNKFVFELKFDGIRAVVEKDIDGNVTIYNRRRLDITARFPDVVAAMAAYPFFAVIDGEIVVCDAAGRPNFVKALTRNQQSRPSSIARLAKSSPARFMPFDVLEARGVDRRGLAYSRRRDLLTRLLPATLVPMASTDGHAMWAFVQEHQLEGLVAKDPRSRYAPGRREPSWVKLKATHRVSALVLKTTPGKGSSRATIGSLDLALWDPTGAGRLVEIGSVGVGSARAVVDLETRLSLGVPVVVEIEYMEVSDSGRLRTPTFKGVRDDVDPTTCTVDSLT